MTTQAMPTPHLAASIPSIPPRTATALDDSDVSVTATFRPHDPIDATDVLVSLDLPDDAALLTLLDVTIARLIGYRDAYRQAMTTNDQPVMDEDADPAPVRAPLPLPWYAW